MKQMVDDFRNYAKLPPAVLLPTDLNALLDDVGDLYRQAGKPVTVRVDPSIPRIYADEPSCGRFCTIWSAIRLMPCPAGQMAKW